MITNYLFTEITLHCPAWIAISFGVLLLINCVLGYINTKMLLKIEQLKKEGRSLESDYKKSVNF